VGAQLLAAQCCADQHRAGGEVPNDQSAALRPERGSRVGPGRPSGPSMPERSFACPV